MTFKKAVLRINILILLFLLLFTYKIAAGDNNLLIIYEQRYYFGEEVDIVTTIGELSGHFHVDTKELNQKDYKKGIIKNYEYIIVLGNEGNFNRELIQELAAVDKKIYWIGKGFERFLNYKDLSIEYIGRSSNPVQIIFSDNIEGFNEPETPEYIIPVELDFELYNIKRGKIHSYLSDGIHTYPFIFRQKNIFYMSRFFSNDMPYYIFADSLHDFFSHTYHYESKEIYIRLEDVHPFSDTRKLKEIGEYLYNNKIPFLIGVIPAYLNSKGKITLMSEVKEFVETIQYLQKLGGTVVLHGFTHQNLEHYVTGEGYEFWDPKNDRPLNIDIAKYIDEKVKKGLYECWKNEIYPLAFEAPHFAMSQQGYRVLKRYFSTYNGDLQTGDLGFNTVVIPYKTYNTKLSNKTLSGTIGYINPSIKLPVKKIIDNYRKISLVRDFTAGVFYHHYLDIEYLKEMIEEFKKLDLKFYDLKQEYNWVKYDNFLIESIDGEIRVSGELEEDYNEKLSPPIINKLIFLILFFIFIMFIVFYFFNKKSNKDLIGGKEK